MAIERLVRAVIPIQSHSRKRVESVEIERPEAGLRWGKPSRFDISVNDLDENNPGYGRVEYPHQHVYINGVEVSREYEVIRVENNKDPTQFIDAESIKHVLFFLGREIKDVERRESNNFGVTRVTPIEQTIDTYLRFNFESTFNKIGDGFRGEPIPEETPEAESVYDILQRRVDYGDQS